MVDETDVASFNENGYLAVEEAISPAEVAELQAVADSWVEASRSVSENTELFDLEPTHSAAHPQVRRVKNPGRNDAFARLPTDERILTIVKALLGNNVRGGGSKLNMKLAHVGSPVHWHQDWAFYPQSNDDALAVGLCIDDATIENGAMLVMPGSHRGPTLDHFLNGDFVGAVTDPEFTGNAAVPLCVRAGGLTVHHVRTLHASAQNSSGSHRRFLIMPFFAADAFPIRVDQHPRYVGSSTNCELSPAPSKESIVAGSHTPTARWVPLPVRIPLPRVTQGATGNSTSGSIYESHSVLPDYDVKSNQLRWVTDAWATATATAARL